MSPAPLPWVAPPVGAQEEQRQDWWSSAAALLMLVITATFEKTANGALLSWVMAPQTRWGANRLEWCSTGQEWFIKLNSNHWSCWWWSLCNKTASWGSWSGFHLSAPSHRAGVQLWSAAVPEESSSGVAMERCCRECRNSCSWSKHWDFASHWWVQRKVGRACATVTQWLWQADGENWDKKWYKPW